DSGHAGRRGAGLRRRDEGPGLAELRDGLLNERSTQPCIPGLLRLRDQLARLAQRRHRVGEDIALGEHVDPVLRVSIAVCRRVFCSRCGSRRFARISRSSRVATSMFWSVLIARMKLAMSFRCVSLKLK